MSEQTTDPQVPVEDDGAQAQVDTPETAPTVPAESTETVAPSAAESPAASSIEQPGVAAPENALVGDENQPDVREVEVDVNTDAVPAQVQGPPAKPVEEVYVHETSVRMDEPVLDPSSPEAVQIPDAGRGTLDLPIHALSNPTPEAIFAKANDEAKDKA